MARFYPPAPTDVIRLSTTVQPNYRSLQVTLPYDTSDENEVGVLRDIWPTTAQERAGIEQARNFVTNPSAEAGLTEWGLAGGAVVTPGPLLQDTAWSTTGAKAFRYSATAMGVGGQLGSHCPSNTPVVAAFPVAPGQAWSGRFDYKCWSTIGSPTTLKLYVQLNWYTSADVFISAPTSISNPGVFVSNLTAGATGFCSILNAVAPATAAKLIAGAVVNNGTGTGMGFDLSYDSFIMVRSSAIPTYFDGDSPLCDWLGAPHISQSVRYG